MRGIKCVLLVSALFGLAACGGGGGGGGDDTPPPAPAQNARPTVSAGNDATATLPNATVALSGSATDDGPAASLQYQWSSDPTANISFSAATAAATNATFTAAGTYTLTLTANDGTQTGTDSLTVTVGDAPVQTQVWPADDTTEDVLHGWAKVEAVDVGMTQGGLDAAAAFAITIPTANIDPNQTAPDPGNGMIVRHGQLVHFWGDLDERKDMKSVTKSMGGIVLGLAIDENKVALTRKAFELMPLFGTPPPENATNAQLITLAQLATHASGFEKEDNAPTGIVSRIQAAPATQWTYSDAGLNWLADVLTFVYQQDLAVLADEKVWRVLGLSGAAATGDDVRWRINEHRPATRDGGTLQYRELASGINANVNAMARVGLLFLRKGMWKETRVLSEAFVNQVQAPLPENKDLPIVPNRSFEKFPNAPTDYGVLWWTNKSKTMANLPADTFWAWGLGEELIVVIPSLDLVIVRNGGQATASGAGRTWNDRDWDGDVAVLEPFLEPIVAGMTP